jgi:hypothetical protein
VLQVGILEKKKGTVVITYLGAGHSEPAIQASEIHPGDVIKTGADGQAMFRWYGPQESRNCLGLSRFECDVSLGSYSAIRIAGLDRQGSPPAFSCAVDRGIVRFAEKSPRINDVCSRVVLTPTALIEVLASQSSADFTVQIQQNPTPRTMVAVIRGKIKVRRLPEDLCQEQVLESAEALTVSKETEPFAVRKVSRETIRRLIRLTTIPGTSPDEVAKLRLEAEKQRQVEQEQVSLTQTDRAKAEMQPQAKVGESPQAKVGESPQAKVRESPQAKVRESPKKMKGDSRPLSMSKARRPHTTADESSAETIPGPGRETFSVDGGLRKAEEARTHYPQFPWPPPRASVVEVVPRELLELKEGPTLLSDVDRRISESLSNSGYFDSRYYAVPEGFALVTRMEQIESDGSPKSGSERWALEISPVQFSLDAYVKALFRGRPGYYRIIVFIVTPHDVEQSDATITEKWAKEWLKRGLNKLPQPLGDLKFSQAGYACTALIYEFERTHEGRRIEVRCPGQIPARNHLVKAGIWEALHGRSR